MQIFDNSQVAWIVDVQKDFMDPPEKGGRLYVRHLADPADTGAISIRKRLGEVVSKWRQESIPMVFTGDWHKDTDPEISEATPDFQITFPPHCMGASMIPALRDGAELIPEVRPDNLLVLSRDPAPGDGDIAADEMIQTGRPLFIQKHKFSVFEGNSEAAGLIEGLRRKLDEPEFLVCGVATDVCVKQAVDGLLTSGARVAVIPDLIWGLGLQNQDALLAGWKKQGARIVNSTELWARPARTR